MKKSERMQKVAAINRNFENVAGTLFSNAQSKYDQQLRQLEQLKIYRDEYADRLKNRVEDAISPAELNDYRFFFRSLDDAILSQEALIDKLGEEKASTHSEWMKKRQETRKMEKLSSKLRQDENRSARQKEQKEHDELGQLLYNFRKTEQAH